MFSTTLLMIFASTVLAAPPAKSRVSLEVCAKSGSPAASQQWFKVLTDLGVEGLQIRAFHLGDEMNITERGSKENRQYKVVGILAADNTLHVPGGRFSPNDTGKLRKWLEDLGDQGAEGVTEKRSAFGFTPRQLEQAHNDLRRTVDFSTMHLPTSKVIDKTAAQLKTPLSFDPGVRQDLAGLKVADELQGLSSGTALAILLRPAGLVLQPQRPTGGEIHYRVGKPAGGEAWPAGWKTEAKVKALIPDMLEFLNVEIKEVPVTEAIEAIQGRLKVPFVFDRNAMAMHAIDPTAVQADVPGKRMTYSQVLSKILLQAKLKYEVRLDENDKPFVWITSVKSAARSN